MSLWTTGETITAERINSQRADWSEDDSTSLAYIANKQLVEDEITQTQSDVGNLSNLTTTAKSSLVAAVNEVDADVSSLQTSVATNTSEITQLKSDLGDLDAIKTALLACFDGVAWSGTNGQALYNALYVALYDPYWTITVTFTNCTSSNNSASIIKGEAYTATISANAGYTLTGATVTVTMNSVDITSQVYSNGVITIDSVTGNLVISVACAVMPVTSISAVYTQSGTVYTDDSLDTLKDDLVVTATYEDSSTATVPSADYTLSGTLVDGTSTITVTYEELTTIFTMTATDYYNQYNWSLEAGNLVMLKCTSSLNSSTGNVWSNIANAGGNAQKRRTFVGTRGHKAIVEYGTSEDLPYFPIPIPRAATQYTITANDSSYYIGVEAYSLSDDAYAYSNPSKGSGYSAGTKTVTFEASADTYMIVIMKQNSAGSGLFDDSEPSALSIVFE